MEPGASADFLGAAWSNEALADRARCAAPDFRARMVKPVEIEAAEIVETLL